VIVDNLRGRGTVRAGRLRFPVGGQHALVGALNVALDHFHGQGPLAAHEDVEQVLVVFEPGVGEVCP